tara:strand:- start:705 stop:1052 length:348 start_codon:yes stop_codon:yes gene_type:complete
MYSLKLTRDFESIFSQGVWLSKRNSPVKVRMIPEGSLFVVGLISSRKTGNAVKRNKAKRQVRSILREMHKSNYFYGKFAIIFTRQFVDCTFEEKRDRLNRILQGASVKQNRNIFN